MPALALPGTTDTPLPMPTLGALVLGAPDDGTGDSPRDGGVKINDNFTAILGTLQKTGPVAYEVPAVQTVNYTASVGCFCIRMDATGGAKTVTMPPASDVKGHCYEIIKWDSSGNSVSLVPDGTDTLFAAGAAISTTTQYGVLTVRSVGDGWVKV